MTPDDLLVALLTGGLLIAFGSVPGLLDSFSNRVRNLLDEVSFGGLNATSQPLEQEKKRAPLWLAGIGAIWIALCVSMYIGQ